MGAIESLVLIALGIGLIVFGIWLLYISVIDFQNHKFSFWTMFDFIIGLFLVFGGGGASAISQKKTSSC